MDSFRSIVNKIQRLKQGDCPNSAYATYFRLLAFGIPWYEETLVDQFLYGLHNDMKNIFLHFPRKSKIIDEGH